MTIYFQGITVIYAKNERKGLKKAKKKLKQLEWPRLHLHRKEIAYRFILYGPECINFSKEALEIDIDPKKYELKPLLTWKFFSNLAHNHRIKAERQSIEIEINRKMEDHTHRIPIITLNRANEFIRKNEKEGKPVEYIKCF